jgi:hypothetical protein
MIWGGKLSVDPDRAKGFQGIRGGPSERRPGQSLREAGRSFSKQNPGGPKPFRGIVGDFLDAGINPQKDQ